MIQDKNIRFAETPGAAFQDMGFKPKTFIAAKRFYYLPKVVLHYRKHANNSDKNNGKVFAVCDAHDDTDKWLIQNIPNWKDYRKIANQCRFTNYVWNLRRLSGVPKEDFRKRFSSEYQGYYANDALEKMYFDDKSWLKLLSVIYLHNIIYPMLRALVSILSPIYRTCIRGGYKIRYIFNKIEISRDKI